MNKNLLSPSELLNDKFEQSNNKKTNLIKNQLKSTDQVKESIIKNPESSKNQTKENQINSLQELINFANQKKEVELKYDLERNVKLVSFNKGKIDISFNEKLSKNFIKNLTEKLLAWTGDRWVISLSKKDGNKTIYEQNTEIKTSKLEKESNSQTAKKLFSAFPDAKLIEVKDKKND